MKDVNFIITKDQKAAVDQTLSPLEIIVSTNAHKNGYKVKLSAIGGHQEDYLNAIQALKNIGIYPT